MLTRPHIVDWALTMKCNLSCQHCRGMTPDELSTEDSLRLAHEIVELDPGWVIIEGGEPLLRDGIWEILKVLQGLDVNLITNGTLIDSENARRLKELNVKVMLSLDSPRPDVYEMIRTGARFSDVLDGGEKLAAQGILHSLNVALSKHNYRDLPGIFSLAREMGTGIINILGLKPCERYEAQLLTREEYEIAIRSACESTNNGISFFFDEPFFHAAVQEWDIELPEQSEHGKILAPESAACIFGDYVFIEPNGEVKPCTFAPYVLGNARDGINDVWRSMQASEFLTQIRDPDTRTGYCRTCEHLSICKGCRSRTYALTGDWFASDPACPLAKNG